MEAYVWSKAGPESGQPIEAILDRKEAERRAGSGTFFWGHATSLGPDVYTALRDGGGEIGLYFTEISSRPRLKDVWPTGVRLWTHYLDGTGNRYEIPPWAIVTSSEHGRPTHRALLCRSEAPLNDPSPGLLDPATCATYRNGKPPGASQVTALVRGTPPPHSSGRPILFAARLLDAVTLTDYRLLSNAERKILDASSGQDWAELCTKLRD